MRTQHPYPVGTRVRLLADVSGDDVLGTVAGHLVYLYPGDDLDRVEDGYAVHLDRGAFLDRTDLPIGRRPWVGTIVAHRDAVEQVAP